MEIDVERDLLPEVDDARGLLRLIAPDDRLVSAGQHLVYAVPGTGGATASLNGIIRVIKELMVLEFLGIVRPAAARTVGARARPRPPSHRRPAPAAGVAKPRGAMAAVKGSARGTLVHEHVVQLAFTPEAARRNATRAPVHPLAKVVHQAYRAHGCVLARAEVPVAEPRGRFGTRLDGILVERKSGRLHGSELKTGHSKDFDKPRIVILDVNGQPCKRGDKTTKRYRFAQKWRPELLQALAARAPEFGLTESPLPPLVTPKSMAIVQVALGTLVAVRWLQLPLESGVWGPAIVLRVDETRSDWHEISLAALGLFNAVLYDAAVAAGLRLAARGAAKDEEEDSADEEEEEGAGHS